jgi:Ca2+/Na+ antiporter
MTKWERLKYAMVRPDDEPDDTRPAEDRPIDEIELDVRRSNDKERTIGFVVAPVAAIVGLVISSALIDNARSHGQSVRVFEELTYVMLGLAVLILVSSLLRKRLFQGITIALFGVAVFQLKYSYVGFAAPFVLVGAWYLVRSYRLQQELKKAQSSSGGSPRPTRANGSAPRARPNKRYTPPT